MADLYQNAKRPISLYKDRRYAGDAREREEKLKKSTTLYVGNLSFYTNEEQVFALFSRAGEVKRIIMGLDRIKKTPCGFCFVEYFTRSAAEDSVNFLSGTKLDGRTIRVDYDTGFEQGRQFGRGRSGGQVRDEYRTDYDWGRGGRGKQAMSGEQLWYDDERDRGRGRRGRGGFRGGGRGRGRRYSGGSMPYHGGGGGGGKRRRSDFDAGRDEYRHQKHARLDTATRLDMPLGAGNGGWGGPRGSNRGPGRMSEEKKPDAVQNEDQKDSEMKKEEVEE